MTADFGDARNKTARSFLRARADAHQLTVEHAAQLGANAIIGVRYDANEITAGVTEVLAYGTAVQVEVFRG